MAIKDTIYQPLMVVSHDRLAFPIRLNNRLSGLLNALQVGDTRPDDGYQRVFDELMAELHDLQARLDAIIEDQIIPLNALIEGVGLPVLRYELPYSRR